MKINKSVLLPILLVQLVIIAIVHFSFEYSILFQLPIILTIGLAGGMIYKSFCNYKGEFYSKNK